MKVFILEDELASREILKTLLSEFFKDIQIIGAASTVSEALPLIRKHQPDIVFLDIELPMQDGFELLNYFDPVPFKIIFTTAFEEYALRAFRISAVDYLLKPIDIEELGEALKKAKNTISPQQSSHLQLLRNNYFGQDPKLSIATVDGYLFVKIKDIVRCKADGRYTTFFLSDGSKQVTARNIGEFENILRDFSFLRVHRSQIINLNKIKKFIKGRPAEVIMEDNSQVLVANSQREALMEFLGL